MKLVYISKLNNLFQEDSVRGVCGPAGANLSLSGSPGQQSCSLHIPRVSRAMHGHWVCLLNEISQFRSAKVAVPVQVGVATKLSWIVQHGGERSTAPLPRPLLTLTEGDTVTIVCQAGQAFPAPEFSWRARRQSDSSPSLAGLPPDWSLTPATHTLQPGGHLYTAQQSITNISVSLADNGTEVVCSGQQGDSLYRDQISLLITVSPQMVSTGDIKLSESVGIVSGILLAIIFVILLFILLAVFLSRRRKLAKKEEVAVVSCRLDCMAAAPPRQAGSGIFCFYRNLGSETLY